MGLCMTKICQCHFCRCCILGPRCWCCVCCRECCGEWWMCSDCCEEPDEDYAPVESRKPQKKPDDGEGMYQYENGDFYVGEWRRGKRHGYGVLTKKDNTRLVGFFYDDEYVGEKPDERLKRSPVTSRPFSKPHGDSHAESGGVRDQDAEQIAKAKMEEDSSDKAKLLESGNGVKYESVDKS